MSAIPRWLQYGKESSEVFVGGMAIMITKQFLHIIRRLIIESATSRILRQIQLESFAKVGVRSSLRDIAASIMLPKNGLNKTYHCRIANFPRCVQREDYRRTGEINSRFLEATGNDSRRYATWDRWFLILEKMLVVLVFTPCKMCKSTATRDGRCGIGDVSTETVTVAGCCSMSKY